MKKRIAILLTIVMLLSLAACGGGEPEPNMKNPNFLGNFRGVSCGANLFYAQTPQFQFLNILL